MAVGDQDLAAGAMFRDFGVTIVKDDGQTTLGHFDFADEMEAFGGLGGGNSVPGQVAEKPQVTFATGALTGLGNGVKLTVDGASYKVRTVRKIGDGKLSVAELIRA